MIKSLSALVRQQKRVMREAKEKGFLQLKLCDEALLV